MKIVVCCKAVRNEADIKVGAGGSLDASRAAWTVGSYDLHAVEAGKRLVEATPGATLVGLMAGGSELTNVKLKKEVGSRGLDELAVIVDDALVEADALTTARALASAIGAMGDVDLVLCGPGSGDEYAQAVGPMLGELLGRPVVNAVDAVEPDGAGLRVERSLAGAVQVLSVPLPAVLAVTSSINTPRIPGMRDILSAGKIPLTELPAPSAAPAPVTRVSTTAAPRAARAGKVLEGTDEATIAELAALIRSAL
ncbi:electron transfer flavoprotein [Xylanimonas allomyrinae]|uniref:Electron transfer flavoprotein small subunit n=1 Tax=Xylanimonas allomyrinae TaxID=2509459 RepID=A0A4P6EPY2_9MICO|nr:electron transfer flavoprotein [Xylanimonas allomyrinae]QAY64546.1 electron transfer flavoprotein [Xylanimonas allomyrinae]